MTTYDTEILSKQEGHNGTLGSQVCDLLNERSRQKRSTPKFRDEIRLVQNSRDFQALLTDIELFTTLQKEALRKIDSIAGIKTFLANHGYPDIIIFGACPISIVRQLISPSEQNSLQLAIRSIPRPFRVILFWQSFHLLFLVLYLWARLRS